MSVPRLTRALAGLVVALAAACSENTGPKQIVNPVTTTEKIQAVDSVFTVPVITAFTNVGDLIDPSSGLANATALVRATQPVAPRPTAEGYAGAAQRYRAFTGLTLAPTNPQGLIPEQLKGKTFEWDTLPGHERHYVVTDRPGAPANGVRFILYAINPLTRRPAEPLVEVGYVDLEELSSESTLSLRIIVAGVGGTPTYVNYIVAGTVTPGQFDATANGFISNGESGDAGRTLTFDLSATLTAASFTFNASLSLDHPAVTISETATATKADSMVTLTIDFTLTEPDQKLQLLGTVTVTDDERFGDGHGGRGGRDGEGPRRDHDGVVTADLEVRLNDQLFATIKGTGSDIQILGADGQPLNEDNRHTLHELFELPARVFNFFQDLLHPVRRCFHV